MIENLAVVSARSEAGVRLAPFSRSGCARCDAGEGCGGGVFGRLIQRRLAGLDLPAPEFELTPGDVVVLGLPARDFLKATALIYLLPLLMMFAAAGVGMALGLPDLIVGLAGMGGLIAGLLVMPWLRQRGLEVSLNPTVLRRASLVERESGLPKVCDAA